jgi:hypothetical protein
MTAPMTTKSRGKTEIVEEDEILEFSGAKGPYGGDPYFRGPLMNPLPQYNYPNIKQRIYVRNELPAPTQITTSPPISNNTGEINYVLYISIAIFISVGILVLLLRK